MQNGLRKSPPTAHLTGVEKPFPGLCANLSDIVFMTYISSLLCSLDLAHESELPMASPKLPALQVLQNFDPTSPDFGNLLRNFLREEEYILPHLQGDELIWFIDYLDKVRPVLIFLSLHSISI
jgi:hypothetical protein